MAAVFEAGTRTGLRRLATSLAVAVAVTACGSGSTTRAASSTTAACGATAPTGTGTRTIVVGGRPVLVHVPPSYSGARRVPLVLNLHGSESRAAAQERFSGMDATADAQGFVVAYPQARIPAAAGFDWNVPGVPLRDGQPVPAGAPDDVAFLRQVVTSLSARLCVDPTRVDATGFSGGARMASQLGCDASDVFAAIAPVSGLRFPAPCASARAVPVLAFHGTADPVDPYGGHGQSYWIASVPQAARSWADHDGCAPTPTASEPAPTVTHTRYGDCRDGVSVELFTIAGEGHEWPGGPNEARAVTQLLGAQSHAIDANAVIGRFFTTHPKR